MRQVVFTVVLIVGRLDLDSQSFAPIDLYKTDAASDWLLIKRHCIGLRLAGSSVPILIALRKLIGMILAFTGKKMFYVNSKSEVPPKNSKTSRGPF